MFVNYIPEPITSPKRKWIHPCKCTLIAHESCLLTWIQSAEASTSRSRNAKKCPQCGTHYEIISDLGGLKGLVLRMLDAGNSGLAWTGRVLTIAGFAGASAGAVAITIWVLTRYGAWAVRKFFGDECVFFVTFFI
jgi:hypothetical protein